MRRPWGEVSAEPGSDVLGAVGVTQPARDTDPAERVDDVVDKRMCAGVDRADTIT